jgi:RNA polymerase-binding transcription factor DksA
MRTGSRLKGCPWKSSSIAVFDLTVLKQLESELATVQVIVETFQAGTYGQCIACGTEIERDLLRADPLRTTCVAHDGRTSPLGDEPLNEA